LHLRAVFYRGDPLKQTLTRTRAISLVSATIASAAIGSTRGAFAQQSEPLRIAVIPSDIGGEAYYAADAGFFAKAGYRAEFTGIPSGAAISAAVAGGSADVGFSNVVSLAIAHERGLPFTILAPATLHTPDKVTAGILTVAQNAPIRSGKDLNGKTIAINGLNNISDVSVRAWVDQNGGDSKTLKFTELPFPAMPEAVRTGRVDAASIDGANEQLLAQPNSGLRRLANVFNAVGSRWVPSTWFSTTEWVEKHPTAAKAFVRVIAEAGAWANAHHAESADILAKYLRKTPQQVEAVTRAPYALKLTPALIQPSIDLAAKYGVIKKAFPARDLISPLAAG